MNCVSFCFFNVTTGEFTIINVAHTITPVNNANAELIRRPGRLKENTIKSTLFSSNNFSSRIYPQKV